MLATQCLLQRRPKTFAINVDGRAAPRRHRQGPDPRASSGSIGVGGGTGHVIEYRGDAIRALDMEERMTVCNMSIEAGARAGMIAPDETTFAYLRAARARPQGAAWERALEQLAHAAERCRRALRSRGRARCRRARADDHLRHAIRAW